MFRKRRKNENGAIVVEASISLTAFMFAIFTVLTVVNILTAQVKIACAINSSAKEISQYSYLYSLTGLNSSQKELYEAGKLGTQDAADIAEGVDELYTQIEGLGQTLESETQSARDAVNIGDWESLTTSIENAANAVEGTVEDGQTTISGISDSFDSLVENPQKFILGIAKLGISKGFDEAKSKLVAAPLAKAFSKKHLVSEKGGDAEAYLKHLGVVPDASGSYMGGLDFSDSILFNNGSDDIRITVDYKIKVLQLLPIDAEIHFTQSAVTKLWPAGEITATENLTGKAVGEDQQTSQEDSGSVPEEQTLTAEEIAALTDDPDDCETVEGVVFVSSEEESDDASLLDTDKTFKDETLEEKYQAYKARKEREGKTPRDRLDWLEACQRYTAYTQRGNDYNKHCNSLTDESGELLYPYKEVTLSNGKRLDAYNPENGWIVSRKATDLDKITEETYRGYLSEFQNKYAVGTEITSNQNGKAIKGQTLQGTYILEIPATNENLPDIEYYKQIAAEYNVTLRFTPE